MASYNLKYNSDDSVVRHLIIGLLADLNNKVYFYRQIDNDNRRAIDVPFYYSITGDDQFLRDNFLFSTTTGPDCHPDASFADGNYDVVPRGVVNMTSMSIDTGSLVNKRNRGTYTKMNQEGAMEGYTSEFEMIPINISVDVEILVTSTLDAFKVTESIIKKLYKSNNYNVEVGHLNEATYRLAAYYAMPDDFEIQRPLEFTFEDKDKYKITFPIEINSHMPAFEWDTEMHVGNRMFEITSSLITKDDINEPTVAINRGDSTVVVDSTGFADRIVNANFIADSSFNATSQYVSPMGQSNQPAIMLDADAIPQDGLTLNAGQPGQEAVLISTNGTASINTNNFTGPSNIEILQGGAINIKYHQDSWFIIGSSNSNITY